MRRPLIASFVLLPCLLLAAAPVASEEGITLKPGQWKFDISVGMPQVKPTVQTIRPCLTGEAIGPSLLMPWAKEQGCKFDNIKLKHEQLSWGIACRIQGERAKGTGKFETSGDRAEGVAKVSFYLLGQRLSITTKWDAVRTGECTFPAPGAAREPASKSP